MVKKAKKIESLAEDITFSGPGARLRYVRESKSMSLDDVAQSLRLSPQRLAEIENDSYLNLGAGTFARGYLRAYARLVDVPEQTILQEYESLNFDATIPSQKPTLMTDKRIIMRGYKGNSSSVYWIILGLIILVLIVAGFLWRYNHNSLIEKAVIAAPDTSNSTVLPSSQNTVLPATSVAPNNGQLQTVPLPMQTLPQTPTKTVKSS